MRSKLFYYFVVVLTNIKSYNITNYLIGEKILFIEEMYILLKFKYSLGVYLYLLKIGKDI